MFRKNILQITNKRLCQITCLADQSRGSARQRGRELSSQRVQPEEQRAASSSGPQRRPRLHQTHPHCCRNHNVTLSKRDSQILPPFSSPVGDPGSLSRCTTSLVGFLPIFYQLIFFAM